MREQVTEDDLKIPSIHLSPPQIETVREKIPHVYRLERCQVSRTFRRERYTRVLKREGTGKSEKINGNKPFDKPRGLREHQRDGGRIRTHLTVKVVTSV